MNRLLVTSRCRGSFAGRPSRRLLLLLAVVAAAFAVFASVTSAAGPVHIKRTVGPLAFDAPAGALCDFAYHQESLATSNVILFLDEEGNPVREEHQVDQRVLHRNVDTGLTLVEVVHLVVHIDFVTGEITATGNNWHLRNEDGRIVLVASGRYVIDLFTGEILDEGTPNVGSDFAQTICTALGGAPAI